MNRTDPTGNELEEVTLSGLGKTYLDGDFKSKVDSFTSNAKTNGVSLVFTSAYRSEEKQKTLKSDPKAITPATKSLHSAGYAVDVKYTSLTDEKGGKTGDEQRTIIKTAATDAGLSWGGDFKDKDDVHFYKDPGDRDTKIDAATTKYKELTEPPKKDEKNK